MALGAIALVELVRCGLLSRGVPRADRAGWGVLSLSLVVCLDRAAGADAILWRPFMGVAVLWLLAVALLASIKRQPGLSAIQGFAGALVSAPAWLGSYGPNSNFRFWIILATTLGAVLFWWLIWRRFRWSLFEVFMRWPVRREVVGETLWIFVRPRTVLAVAVMVGVWANTFFKPRVPWPAIWPYIVLFVVLTLLVYLLRSGIRRTRFRFIRYVPRSDAGAVVIEALCAMAILTSVVILLAEGFARQETWAVNSARELAARERLAAEAERIRALPFAELERLPRASRRKVADPALPEAELVVSVGPDESNDLWRVCVAVEWNPARGGRRCEEILTLRARVGGPK